MSAVGIPYQRRQVLYLLGDVLVGLIAIQAGHDLRFGFLAEGTGPGEILTDGSGAVAVFLISNLFLLYVAETYDTTLDFRRPSRILRIWLAVGAATLAQMVLFYASPSWWWGRGLTLLTNLGMAIGLTGWRGLAFQLRPRLDSRRHTLILGAGEAGQEIVSLIHKEPEQRRIYRIVGFLEDHPTQSPPPVPVVGTTQDLVRFAREYEIGCVIVAILSGMSPDLTTQLLDCKAAGIRVMDVRTLYRRMTGKLPLRYLSRASLIFGPGFETRRPVISAAQRLTDITLALVGLALCWPVILIAAIAVRLESKGPAFYTQERVGQDEEPFTIIKLRTMCEGAEAPTGPVWSQGPMDPRVTRVGRFLRRSRIDELPQFLNILWGDMSMVGPRPERPHFVSKLKRQIPYYGLRFAVKPGVTGWAQVMYRYGASEEDAQEKLAYDLFAIQELSPQLYALIILKTIQTVLHRPGS